MLNEAVMIILSILPDSWSGVQYAVSKEPETNKGVHFEVHQFVWSYILDSFLVKLIKRHLSTREQLVSRLGPLSRNL